MSRTIKLIVEHAVQVPDKATHYAGELLDTPTFYYCSQVGVAGDHWWFWHPLRSEWVLASHYQPHNLKELPA
jgi:hypothetical protein